jgi:hypothetical protein
VECVVLRERKQEENGKLLKMDLNYFYTPPFPKKTIMGSISNDEYRILLLGSQHELMNGVITESTSLHVLKVVVSVLIFILVKS